MKTGPLPTLRVTPKLRNLEARRTQKAFIARGLASSERAKKSGRYITADAVLRKLSRRAAAVRAKRKA